MAGGSVKLFQFNQKYCQSIGIELPNSNENRYTFSVILIFVTIFAMALFGYLVYGAQSMAEYGIVFFVLINNIFGTATYYITIWKMKDISKFTQNCEQFIEKSKSLSWKTKTEPNLILLQKFSLILLRL